MIKEHYNHWFPKLINARGVTIYNHIFYSLPEELVYTRLRRHEMEHVKQYKRDGFFRFLLRYFYEYFINRFKGMSHYEAYLNISYEIEARKAESANEGGGSRK